MALLFFRSSFSFAKEKDQKKAKKGVFLPILVFFCLLFFFKRKVGGEINTKDLFLQIGNGLLTYGVFCFIIIGEEMKGGYSMTVTKKSIIGDVLDQAPDTAQFFFAIGMHCLGCPSARGESIADACAVHGTDADALIKQINDFLAAEGK